MRHVIWDWNGTLFDDLHIVVEAVNASIAPFGGGPISADDYRNHYQRPVIRFYEALLGRPVGEAEWSKIDVGFHELYRESLPRAGLADDAMTAIEMVKHRGWSQSLLSMWWHDELVPFAHEMGVAGHMVRVDGNQQDAGGAKAVHLEQHINALLSGHELAGDTFVVIGDALDDASAAATVGVACVLYDSGSHLRAELEATGAPVADSLVEALTLAGVR